MFSAPTLDLQSSASSSSSTRRFRPNSADTVFFGPDTYRFARALRHAMAGIEVRAPFTIIDIGCGSGAGGLLAALQLMAAGRDADVILSDINPKALRYASINARAQRHRRTCGPSLSDVFDQINDAGDLIISNPPYLVDALGAALSPRRRRIRLRAFAAHRRGRHRPPASGRAARALHRHAGDRRCRQILTKRCNRCWLRAVAPTPTKRSIPTSSARSSSARLTTVPTGSRWCSLSSKRDRRKLAS